MGKYAKKGRTYTSKKATNSKDKREKRGFIEGTLQDQLKKTNNFAKRNLYPPGSY